MADVDEELEGDGEAVFHQPGGDEHALRIAQRLVAMADGAVGELHVVAVGDHGVVAHVQRERDEVVGLAIKRRGNGPGHGVHHALQIGDAGGDLSHHRVADAVGGLRYRRHAHDFGGSSGNSLGRRGHERSIVTQWQCGSLGSLGLAVVI